VTAKPNTLMTYTQQNITPTLSLNLPDGTLAGWAAAQLGDPPKTYLIKSNAQGTVTLITPFPNSDIPSNIVIYGTDGNFYGVAQSHDNASAYSYVYQVTPGGAFREICAFSGDYFGSLANSYYVVQTSGGSLYGVTPSGGSAGGGTFYQVSTSGQYTLLYSFPRSGATAQPQARSSKPATATSMAPRWGAGEMRHFSR
jgi:uncharacterized repeat protein (TIGR03803 family)